MFLLIDEFEKIVRLSTKVDSTALDTASLRADCGDTACDWRDLGDLLLVIVKFYLAAIDDAKWLGRFLACLFYPEDRCSLY